MSNQVIQDRTERYRKSIIQYQANGTNLGISHDSLILTVRIKRKNIIRYVDLCLFCNLSVSFQNLRHEIEESNETFKYDNPRLTKL